METQRELNNIWTIASKEFVDNIKSKRFILMGILYLVIALLVTIGAILQYRGAAGAYKPNMLLQFMDYLNIILVLLAAVVTADTLSLEKMNRTLYQLLSKPVERSSVILGKFFGCLGIVSALFVITSTLAYVLAFIVIGSYPSAGDIIVALEVMVSMVILFAVYVGIGVLISTVTRNPMMSIIGSILVWIVLFVSNTVGGAIGIFSSQDAQMAYMMGADPFPYYPIYSQILVFIDPISHDIVKMLIGSNVTQADGIPLWANTVYLILIAVIVLLASSEIFKRQDI